MKSGKFLFIIMGAQKEKGYLLDLHATYAQGNDAALKVTIKALFIQMIKTKS